MKNIAPKAIAVQHVLDDVLRRERGRILAGLIIRLEDFQRAEDALQEASISALKHWSRSGIPHSPIAWLMKTSFNKGIDIMRVKQRELKKAQDMKRLINEGPSDDDFEIIADERLRLIFTCCHPALHEKSRVALTLRTVCGLTTREIAAAFLDTEATMGQRLSRAKAKIRSKGIRFSIPEPDQWAERIKAVLQTIYLIFTTGYVNDDKTARDLCQEGLFLSRLLHQLQPNEPEIAATLALILLTKARSPARIDAKGALIPIEKQDQGRWRHEYIIEAQNILKHAIKLRCPGPFQIKAAIADCHMMRPKPDWPQMSFLYQSLWAFEPTPIVALNWAVVIAETGHDKLALQQLNKLQADLHNFQPWHAARAHILEKLGLFNQAHKACQQAIETAPNKASQRFLEQKRCVLSSRIDNQHT